MSNFFVAVAVFVITVMAALFTVPYFIDWNGYRGLFEEEASRLLAREVRVGGAVNLHLLPTPYVSLEKVRIAENAVNLEASFFRADSVTIRLAVAPILRGAIEANEIQFQRPVLRLAMNAADGWNWQSFAQALGNATYMPSNVALTSIKITDGVLALHGPDGAERTRMEGLEGEVSAPALDGPYRFHGTFGKGPATREIRIATAKPESDGAVRFKTSLRLADVGSTYVLDGRLLDLMGKPRIDGELSAQLPLSAIWQPQRRAQTRSGPTPSGPPDAAADGDLMAFDLKAAVQADAAGASLSDLALSFERDGHPQLLTGDAKADWRHALAVTINLSSRWLDLDRIAGAQEDTSPLQTAIPLALKLRDLLPADGRSRARFTVDQATIGRDTISGVHLALSRSKDSLEVEELRLAMPGGSRGELQGVVSGLPAALALEGSFGLRGTSVVRFLTWATGNALPADARGDGPFALRSRLSIVPGQARFQDLIGDLSGTTLFGQAHYRWEGKPELALTLEGPQIDARAFIPAGSSLPQIFGVLAGRGDNLHGAPGQEKSQAKSQEKSEEKSQEANSDRDQGWGQGWSKGLIDTHIRLNAGQLMTAGRTYRDVAMELEFSGGRLRLPQLRIAGDEGYSIELDGDVQDLALRPKGTIRVALSADAAQGMAPLAELLQIQEASRPNEQRAQAMVPLRLAGALSFGARTPTSADLVLDGEANGARVKLNARLDGAPDGWRKGAAELTALLDGPDAGRLVAALLGSSSALGREGAGSGRILLEAAGVPAEGLTTIASVASSDVDFAFRGLARSNPAGSSIAGELEIKGVDGTALATLAGLAPPLKFDQQPVSGSLKIEASPDGLKIDRLALRLGDDEVRGHMALTTLGPRRRIEGNIDVAAISLTKLLGPLVDQRFAVTGAAEAAVTGSNNTWTDDAFALGELDRLQGRLTINAKRLALAEGIGLSGASVEVVLDGGKIDVRQLRGSGLGGQFTARVGLDKAPGGAELRGSVAFDAKLEAFGATAGGVNRARGPVSGSLEFSGRGTSPRGLISVLQGKGRLEFGDAKLANLWPGAIATAVDRALKLEPEEMGAALKQDIAGALGDGFIPLGPGTVDLDIVDGQLRTAPLALDSEQGRTTGSASLDLRTLTFDSEWKLEQKTSGGDGAQKDPLPGITVNYRGPIAAVADQVARVNADAMVRELSVRRMERDVEELERVRRLDEERRRSDAWHPREQPEATRPDARPANPPTTVPRSPLDGPPRVQPAAPG